MKSILISIKPKYVAKILNGEKTIEIRKTMPKCDLPIDVYIYCTKDKNGLVWDNNGKDLVNSQLFPYSKDSPEHNRLVNGKVVAKFTLNKVEEIEYKCHWEDWDNYFIIGNRIYDDKETCVSEKELLRYLDFETGYAWHISNLVIFDEPKELWEYETTQKELKNVIGGEPSLQNKRLTKAPQSWQFIEVGE